MRPAALRAFKAGGNGAAGPGSEVGGGRKGGQGPEFGPGPRPRAIPPGRPRSPWRAVCPRTPAQVAVLGPGGARPSAPHLLPQHAGACHRTPGSTVPGVIAGLPLSVLQEGSARDPRDPGSPRSVLPAGRPSANLGQDVRRSGLPEAAPGSRPHILQT